MNKFKPYGIGNTKPNLMVVDLQFDSVGILGKNSRDHIQFKTPHGYKNNSASYNGSANMDTLEKNNSSCETCFDQTTPSEITQTFAGDMPRLTSDMVENRSA